MHPLIWFPLGVTLAIIARICVIVVMTPMRGKRAHTETCHLAVFLGSGKLDAIRIQRPYSFELTMHHFHAGGHSSEALSLVSALDFSRYTPRTYIVSEGDLLSEQKAVALERLKSANVATSSLASARPDTLFFSR
jgi:beta-1,4-N-acetylglucosaminyltransferase